ncbi:YkvA family protein [Leptolyngbya sp. AN03gr2]|uniref:YkvA family protein n=1 Tax=unclassified Leptolyngbya TaxID=2650499 RepID=UPI003D31EA47
MKKFIGQPLYNWYRTLLRNSKYRWIVIVGSLLYLVSPIDFVTDMIPVLGWIDDGVVVSILVAEASQILGEQLKQRKAKTTDATAY